MTEKRFINDIDNGKLIDTKGELSTIHYSDKVDFYELWEFLNKLNDENEQLRKENDMLSCELSVSANKEISRNCRIAELEEGNEQLKQHNTELINKIDFLERIIGGDV